MREGRADVAFGDRRIAVQDRSEDVVGKRKEHGMRKEQAKEHDNLGEFSKSGGRDLAIR